MKMVSMKRTAKEKKARDTLSVPNHSDDVPYGLHVSLDHDSLDKLGVKTLPKVGDKLHLQAHAHVASVSEASDETGKKRRNVELHLHKMALQNPAAQAAVQPDAGSPAAGAKSAMDEALSEQG
jgi:hypothetical protein